ncbi:hypothetical protein F5Y17DRAFT_446067 [Xylariaceae sp. FL0594]|nr:hypothetical protein F5Y17DRAFT_446067 [Xylariaceae sp. FL0594]
MRKEENTKTKTNVNVATPLNLLHHPSTTPKPKNQGYYSSTTHQEAAHPETHTLTTNETETATMEWVFGSYRCQAERAYFALRHHYQNLGVRVYYGQDPCDRVD